MPADLPWVAQSSNAGANACEQHLSIYAITKDHDVARTSTQHVEQTIALSAAMSTAK